MLERVSIWPVWPPLVPQASGVVQAFEAWMALRRSRAALARLGDEHLRDVGLTRAEARAEATRSFMVD